MDHVPSLRRASRRLRLVFTVALVAVPLLDALFWMFLNDLSSALQQGFLPGYARPPLPAQARWLGFAASLPPLACALYCCAALIRLFRLYEAGELFRPAAVRCLRDASRALIGMSVASFLGQPLMSLALTLHNPPGQRQLVLGVGTMDVLLLLGGLVLAVMVRVMEEGRRLQEDSDYTV